MPSSASIKRDLTRKPPILPVIADKIPVVLRDTPRWLGWRWTQNNKAGKWDKPPVDIRRDRSGSSTNKTTWCDFSTALRAAQDGFVDGIGFALGDGFAGVDFDCCRDRTTGTIAPDVLAYVWRLDTYGEVSPSGEGVKLILRGELPKGRKVCGHVECYDRGRYFTVTGHRLDGCPSTLSAEAAALAALHRELIEAAQAAQQGKRESRLSERELAVAALAGLSASRRDDYHSWLLVGMALHATDSGLLSEWDSWSRGSAKYSDGACQEKWETFNGSAVCLGSLLHWASADTGWSPPRYSKRGKKRSWQADAARAEVRTDDTFVPRPSTDLGNAERFAQQHGEHVRYVATWGKWLVWDGTRWKIDTTHAIERLAKRTVRAIYSEVAKLAAQDDVEADDLQELTRWAKASEKRERRDALIAMAASEEGIAIEHAILDADPWLLNCANGTVDLRTGELRKHDRSNMLTKSSRVEYPAEPIDTPAWDAFLASTFCGDDALVGFLQRLIGYAACGVIQEHVLPICWGDGSNGKTTLLGAVRYALGDYASEAPPGLLLAKRGEAHPTERAKLFGARLVTLAETDDGGRLNEALVKTLTGGEPIQARRMREDFWEFPPTHTFFLSTNYKPTVRGTDFGIWRRLKLIPFTATFVGPDELPEHPGAAERDKGLPERLRAEAPGILRWIVEGCLAWQQEGLSPPETVRNATKTYRDESDTFKNWLAERCEVAAGHEWKASAAYTSYRDWCLDSGEQPLSLVKFSERIDATDGLERLPRRRDGQFYRGFGPRV